MSKPVILIVDDEPFNVDYLEQELEDLGYDTVSAADGRQALEQVTAQAPDVILLDIMMPVMDGFQTLEQLKSNKAWRDIPVIVISAMDDIGSVARGIQLGAEDYLPKPFDEVLLQARIGSSLEKKRLHDQEQLYLKSLERELEIGRQIQAEFLPAELPQPTGWEIAAYFRAAREVAGDFYDAFTLAQDGKLSLVIGDVSGKGVGAALYMTLFRTLLRATTGMDEFENCLERNGTLSRDSSEGSTSSTLKNTMTLTNRYVAENHGQSSMFATIFFGVLDPVTGSLLYVNGGHEPPIIFGSGRVKDELQPTGPLVGIVLDLDFLVGEARLEPGDTLLAFTDGVTEARSPTGDLFGRERLLDLLGEPDCGVASLLDRVATAVQGHTGGSEQSDDITMLAVRRASHSSRSAQLQQKEEPMLSEFMTKKLTRYFHLRDLDQDGFVEEGDWEQCARSLAEIRGWEPGSAEYEDIIAKHAHIWNTFWRPADLDNDGKVSLEEYLNLAQAQRRQGSLALNVMSDLFGGIFDIIDLDGDGQIAFQDYRLYFKAWGMDEDLAEQAFAQIDLCGDGLLSRGAFIQSNSNFFISDDPAVPGSQLFGPIDR